MSWCPGEDLLARLWETLAEKGLGSLLKPGQMRREGLVNLELERARILTNAQAERDAEEIKSGRKELADFSVDLKFSSLPGVVADRSSRIEPVISMDYAVDKVTASVIREAMRREINTSNAIVFAEESLSADNGPAPNNKIDEDWLYRWSGYAGDVSSEELQRLWGRLLAGEVKEPGSYSLRSLEFLRSLSQSEAKLIEKISKLKIDNFIWRSDQPHDSIGFNGLLELQELGMISGVDSQGLTFTSTGLRPESTSWVRALICHSKCVVIRNKETTATLKFNIYPLTKLGLQIIALGDFQEDENYLVEFGRHLMKNGFEVSIADLVERTEKFIKWSNEVEVLPRELTPE